MRKFIHSQMLLNAKGDACPEFMVVLQAGNKRDPTMPSVCYTDIDCLKLLNVSTAHLPSVSFELNHTVTLLPPLRQCVFPADLVKNLKLLYQQLYHEYNIVSISPFNLHSGRALLCGEVLGSVMNATSCKSASIIMARSS